MENKICIYAICRNESQFVDTWLNSMAEADYIVVLDTGSTDDTFEKLRNDPRVHKVEQKIITPWRFDVARNESMKLIPEDANILVCTDLDEVLEPGWAQVLRDRWIEGVHTRATYKYAWSHYPNGEPARVFQYNKVHSKEWVWNFPVHECLVHADDTLNVDYPASEELMIFDEMYLHHYPDPNKSRSSYLPLLELRKKEYPSDYYGRIYLAHEYYYRGYYEKCIEELEDILATFPNQSNPVETASCYLFMGDAYRSLGNYSATINAYQNAILVDNTYREPYVNLCEVLNELGYYNQVIGIVKDCLTKTYRHYTWLERDSTWTYELFDLLAVAYFYTEDYINSFINARKALAFDPTEERLITNFNCIESKLLEIEGISNV